MGVSSDGILVFGFPIGEEDENPEFLGEAEDMDDFIAGEYEQGKYDERKAKIEACPADLTLYCSYDYPMHILSLRGTEITASRGDAIDITQEQLTIPPEKIASFKRWCEENGIQYQEPRWLLCSMYG